MANCSRHLRLSTSPSHTDSRVHAQGDPDERERRGGRFRREAPAPPPTPTEDARSRSRGSRRDHHRSEDSQTLQVVGRLGLRLAAEGTLALAR